MLILTIRHYNVNRIAYKRNGRKSRNSVPSNCDSHKGRCTGKGRKEMQKKDVDSISCVWLLISQPFKLINSNNLNRENCAFLGYYVTDVSVKYTCPIFNGPEDSWPLKMGKTGFPKRLWWIYHFSLRNNSEQCRSHLFRGGSLKTRNLNHTYLKIKFVLGNNFTPSPS
jgi:hypothetical protein